MKTETQESIEYLRERVIRLETRVNELEDKCAGVGVMGVIVGALVIIQIIGFLL